LQEYQAQNRPIVYLDESGFQQDNARTHGYSAKGARCYGVFDWHKKARTNAIGALLNNQLLAVALIENTINSDVFYAYTEQILLPELPEKTVLVMDNVPFHKHKNIKMLLNEHGHHILWLPAYSPDLNPIEHEWAWVKAVRRFLRLNDIDMLFKLCMGVISIEWFIWLIFLKNLIV
jgi:transposase